MYGAFAREHDGWFPIAALVELLGVLDIEEQPIRAAVSRLKRRGVLVPERRASAAGYAVSAALRTVFEIGDARVFGKPPQDDLNWSLVSFSIPENARSLRYQLRSRLIRVGAGQVEGGLWIAPQHVMRDIDLIVNELNVGEYVSTFTAKYHGYDDLRSKVQSWWSLDEIELKYRAFIEQFASLEYTDATDATAFAEYTRALSAWRPLPYLDPQLPASLLPENWSGTRAYALFHEIRDHLAGPAAQFVSQTMTRFVNTVD